MFYFNRKLYSIDHVNVHWRDPMTALDTTSSMESVHEFLKLHPKVQNLALIQCTSPFVNRNYLRKATRKFAKNKTCIFSVVRSFKLRWKRDRKKRRILPINFDFRRRPRRQDWKGRKLNIPRVIYVLFDCR